MFRVGVGGWNWGGWSWGGWSQEDWGQEVVVGLELPYKSCS